MSEKKEPNTLSTEGQDILKKMQQVETSVANHIQQSNRKLVETRYYKQFTVNSKQGPMTLENVFITLEIDENNKMSYHFRWLDEIGGIIEEKLLVDSDGKAYTMPETEEIFGDIEMDVPLLVSENDSQDGNLKGISKQASPEQARKLLAKKGEKDEHQKEKDEETQQIENDLAEQGVDVEIGDHRRIKDNKVAEVMPEVFDPSKEYEVAEDKKTGDFIIVTREKDGKYVKNEKIESGKATNTKIYTIGPDGEQKESEVPTQSMIVTGHPECEVAITRDQYGYIDMKTVRVTPCQTRIGRSVQMEGEGKNAQEGKKVTDTFEQEGEFFDDEISHINQFLRDVCGIEETTIDELKQLQKIGIDSFMKEEARKAGMVNNVDGFIKEYLKPAEGKKLADKLTNAHEKVREDSRGGNIRPR